MLLLTHLQGATNQPNYDQLCKSYASKLIDEYAKCDYNMSLYDQAYKKWEEYVKSYKEREAKRQYAEFKTAIESLRGSMKKPTTLTFTESEVNILRAKGNKANELLEHNLEYDGFYKEINTGFDILLKKAESPNPSSLAKSTKLSYRSTQLSLEMTYYNMLHTFSKISKAIFNPSLDAKFKSLSHQYKAEVNLPTKEYERMIEATYNKMERVVEDIQKEINTTSQELIIAEDLEARYNSACEALDKIATELEIVMGYTIERDETKETLLKKIEHSTNVTSQFEKCINEYIDSLVAIYEFNSRDTQALYKDRDDYLGIVATLKKAIEYMMFSYEQM